MGESTPARAAQRGRAATAPRVARPGRAPEGRPAHRGQAARFLEPAVRARVGAWVRAVPVPAEPPAARAQRGLRDLGVPLAGTVAVAHRLAEAPAAVAGEVTEARA